MLFCDPQTQSFSLLFLDRLRPDHRRWLSCAHCQRILRLQRLLAGEASSVLTSPPPRASATAPLHLVSLAPFGVLLLGASAFAWSFANCLVVSLRQSPEPPSNSVFF